MSKVLTVLTLIKNTTSMMNNPINQTNKQLKVGHWNCNSIQNKSLIFNKFLNDNNFDVFCLNETKLNKE